MRVRLRYVLPAAQVALAIGLYSWSDAWFREMHGHTMPGPSLGFTILLSVNAPLALLREGYYLHTGIPELYDRLLLLFGVALLWYWVGRNIESWNERGTVASFTWLPLRISADLMLITLGGLWVFIVLKNRLWVNEILAYSNRIWLLSVFMPVVLWAIALLFFFGCDLIQIIRGKQSHSADAQLSKESAI